MASFTPDISKQLQLESPDKSEVQFKLLKNPINLEKAGLKNAYIALRVKYRYTF